MARKPENVQTIDSDIAELEAKLAEKKAKRTRIVEADNIRLGKLVRKCFPNLPESPEQQKVFFEQLAKSGNSDTVVSEQKPLADFSKLKRPVTQPAE